MLLPVGSFFIFQETEKNRQLRNRVESLLTSIQVMILPVTNSADFEETFGEVFTTKFVNYKICQ